MKQTPMYQLYERVAPKPAAWPVLLTKLGEMLRKDYDWSNDVATIKVPTLLCSVTRTPSVPRMLSSSLSSLAAVRRTADGMDRECPMRGSPSCLA